jgi:hypothetical protein
MMNITRSILFPQATDPLGRDVDRALLAIDEAQADPSAIAALAPAADGWHVDGRTISAHTMWQLELFTLVERHENGIRLTDRGRVHLNDRKDPSESDYHPFDENADPYLVGNAVFPQLRDRWITTGHGAVRPIGFRLRGNPDRIPAHALHIEVDHILRVLSEAYTSYLYDEGPNADEHGFDPWRHAGVELARFPEHALAVVFGSLQDAGQTAQPW